MKRNYDRSFELSINLYFQTMEEEFVATESKKQRKKREKEKKRAAAAEQQNARAAKQSKPSPMAALDNAAYTAVFGPDARGSVVLNPE